MSYFKVFTLSLLSVMLFVALWVSSGWATEPEVASVDNSEHIVESFSLIAEAAQDTLENGLETVLSYERPPLTMEELQSSLVAIADTSEVSAFGGFSLNMGDSLELQAAVKTIGDAGNSLGFLMMDIYSGEGVAYNIDEEFYSASTIKAFYVIGLAKQYPETVNTWRNTLRETISESSNEGYDAIRDTYGADPLVAYTHQVAGVSESIAEAYYPDYSTRTLASLWLLNYEYFTSGLEYSDEVKSWYSATLNSVISEKLGSSYEVSTKAGWISGPYSAANDAGIIWVEDSPYLMVIMSNSPSDMTTLEPLVLALESLHTRMIG